MAKDMREGEWRSDDETALPGQNSRLGAPGSSCRAAPGSRWRLIYDGGVMAALMAAAVVQIDLVVAMMTAATDHDHPRRRC